IYWARLDKIYYGCNKIDAAVAGFDDSFIYKEFELEKAHRSKKMVELLPVDAMRAFDAWRKNETRVEY
ncbi:MAG: nucleoside deaminase, partial [Bacteroidaceae bacterium]|nr:nucleoside deaminase [Bacteroidaceae bacterium]